MLFSTLAFLLFALPGLIWHPLWNKRTGASDPPAIQLPERLADGLGLFFSLVALAGMGTYFTGLRFSGFQVLVILAIFPITLILLKAYRPSSPPRQHPSTPSPPHAITHASFVLSTILPLLAFGLVLVLRFYQARSLVLPAWVDSLHHTLLVDIVRMQGGLPRTLAPDLPVPLYYHFGFHANTALFAFLSRLSAPQAVLIFGQLLNALVPLAVYRLAIALWGSPKKGLAAMLLVGFVFQMPAYYLTWGRYTLLAGLFLLALAMSAALDVVRTSGDRREPGLRLAVLVAGLLLTHYFAALVFALFLAGLAIERLLGPGRADSFAALLVILVAGAAGFLATLPWTIHVLRLNAGPLGLEAVALNRSADEAYYPGYLDYLWYLLGPRRSHFALWIGLTGLALLGWRERARPLAVWTLAFGLLTLPWGLNVAPFRPDHGVILAFLPASLHAADLLVTPLEAPGRRWFRLFAGALVVAALGLLVYWGLREVPDIINPQTVLAEQPDVEAAAWVAANTGPESVFFINTDHWQGGAYRGVDGGWWLPLLADRRTILPPVLYLMGEKAYADAVLETARQAAEIDACDADFWALVADEGVTHVYLKWGVGSLQPGALANCQGARLVYDVDGIYIFTLQR